MERIKEPKQTALIKNWQEKASRRRENDAWRAGVRTSKDIDRYTNLQEATNKAKRNSDEGKNERDSGQSSMRASLIKTSDEHVVLAYHPPITTVHFQRFSEEGETRISFSKNSTN